MTASKVKRGGSKGRGSAKAAATIIDVAREAEVSQITVSRVIRKMGLVSDETRDRVLKAIQKLGYVPNRMAGTLAGGQSDLIGVVIPSLGNSVFSDVLRGLHDAFANRGFRVVTTITDYDLELEERHVSSLLALRPAALILTGCDHTEATRAMITRSGLPIVEIMDTDKTPMDLAVGMSPRKAAETSAAYLLQRGYRRFGYVGHDNAHRDLRAWRRRASFLSAVKAGGATVVGEHLSKGPSSVPAGRVALQRLLASHPTVDAVYFSNDDMAVGGIYHCLAEGIEFPGKLAIFGFNGLDIGQTMPKPLSTILTFRYQTGYLAGNAIMARIDEDYAPASIDVGFKLIEGETA